jgi:replication factor C subunit 1
LNLKLKKTKNLRRNITDATVPPTVNSLFTPLLANKYAPKSTNELLGNNNAIKILRNWLTEWQKNKIDIAKNHKKATLIIGSPGIGKTSSIYILCKELGYDIFEVNASDTRGRDSLGDKKRKTTKTGSFIEEITKNSDSEGGIFRNKKILILKDIDLKNSDSNQCAKYLLNVIVDSKIPIICVTNAIPNVKISSLRRHCIELRFSKPCKKAIVKRMLDISSRESIRIDKTTLESLVNIASGDLRFILSQMQIFQNESCKDLYYASKYLHINPFDCAKMLLQFNVKKIKLNDRMDLVLREPDIIPLLVQENYLDYKPMISKNESQRLWVIAKAADALSIGDIISNKTIKLRKWELLNLAVMIGTVYPSALIYGKRDSNSRDFGDKNTLRFTNWHKYSGYTTKRITYLKDFHNRVMSSKQVLASCKVFRLDYISYLKEITSLLILQKEFNLINNLDNFMTEYCISKQDFEYIHSITKYKNNY